MTTSSNHTDGVPPAGASEDAPSAQGSRGTGAGVLLIRGLDVTMATQDGTRTLVRGVDLDLAAGDTLGIVGESGSGKSLTARSVVGLLPAALQAGGSISYCGEELIGKTEREWRKIRGARIGLLLQDPFTMLNPLQSAAATLAESLPKTIRRNRDTLREQITTRLGEVGLAAEVADRYPYQLSGGMRQRLALAAALARDPELLIADEPTTALDVTTQDDVLALLKHIQTSRGMSLIFITHDLRVAFSICDRIQVMYAGSVVEQSPAAKLRSAPVHPYTLGLLLAEPPVDHYVEKLVAIPGRVPAADSVADQCGFADRCGWAQPECTSERPALSVIAADRTSSCIRLDQIGGELAAKVDHFHHAVAEPPQHPPRKPIMTVTDLCKTYRTTPLLGRSQTFTALDNVGFAVGEAESVALVGETGSGKTTIARTILGLAKPDSGQIDLNGVDVADRRKLNRRQRRDARRFTQIVFQDPYASLNPALNVGSILREVLNQRGNTTDPAAEISQLLTRVGLPTSYAKRRPAALSGGEQQRIAIARAIAMKPRLLICDEPVAALDVSAQAQILELLRDIQHTEHLALLFITHDLSVVRQIADHIIVLHHGQIIESGNTSEILDRPTHEYTKRLLAAVPGTPRS